MSYAGCPPPPSFDGYRELRAGDPAPWFEQSSTSDERFSLDVAAGRYIVLGFFVSAGDAAGRQAVSFVSSHRALFDDERIAFFGVSTDWRDRQECRVEQALPGIRHFWDFDLTMSRLYGVVRDDASPGPIPVRRAWFVLDPTLRVLHVIRFQRHGADRAQLLAILESLPPVDAFAGAELAAPVLFLPNVFEPALCERLVALFDARGGVETGFMRRVGDRTLEVHDHRHKRRVDWIVDDPAVRTEVETRIRRRIAPELRKVFQFDASHIERQLVGCYRAETGDHFGPHRDNTTLATAHRRFAVSIGLNDDFDGGDLRFPEYGSRTYRVPPGAALVFSCSLLHAVFPMRRGRRLVFLPFLFDAAAANLLAQARESYGPLPAMASAGSNGAALSKSR